MEEEELIDEEIIKALENTKTTLQDLKEDDDDYEKLLLVKKITNCSLDLIHRLQCENATLKSELRKECDEHEEFTKKAKEEIERLTRESDEMFDRHAKENQAASILIEKRNNEIAELKKQVDEWKNRYLEESKERCEFEQRYERQRHDHSIGISVQRKHWEKKVQQAVKDTAQNALEDFICRLVNARLVGVNDDLYVELLETKDDLLKEKYGVEEE